MNIHPNAAKQITKLVITGGPCAGKTTAMSWIQNAFSKYGYTVLFISETATELISGGVAPWTCGTNAEHQKCQMDLQLKKEEIFLRAAMGMKQSKFLIVCDRGTLDNKAYMNQAEYQEVLEHLQTDEQSLLRQYDAVFHLVTAAKGAEAFYTTANNSARTEDPAQAAQLDDRLIQAWQGHPHHYIIDNTTAFEDKMKRLIQSICSFLGKPELCQTQRRFLVRYPDIAWLEQQPDCRRIDIVQTNLTCAPGEENRVRCSRSGESCVYYQTIKRTRAGITQVQQERRLTRSEYEQLLQTADASRHTLKKTRYCLTWEHTFLEIDLYPFWQDKAIVEVPLSARNGNICLPEQLCVLQEITDDEAYANTALAEAFTASDKQP